MAAAERQTDPFRARALNTARDDDKARDINDVGAVNRSVAGWLLAEL
ncbi:MAG: hypothetical protein IPL40_14990 [Proteobacteria bacterium]|nr:hypothetical protein [Pseudomonadota bacterium]